MQTLRAEPNASVPQNPLGCKPVGRLHHAGCDE